MEYSSTLLLALSFLVTLIFGFSFSNRRHSRLPPGPYPLPIIGNLLALGDKPHRSLTELSTRYGPLMSLKLGSITTIVVSSCEIAKEFFLTHDQAFSGRSIPSVAKLMDHHEYSITWLPTGDQWRKLRRITKEYLLSGPSLEASERLRSEKVQELVDNISECCASEKAVDIGAIAFTTSLNMLSNVLFSKDFSQNVSISSEEFKDSASGVLEVVGKANLADFFPILKPLDLQGLQKEGHVHINKLLTVLDGIIDQRLQRRASLLSHEVSSTKDDVLDLLLNLQFQDKSEFSPNDIKHLLFDLIIAGTDTSSTTLEWAMTELIRNPKKMETARSELNRLMENSNNKIIQEKDISQLPYLQAVIKETLRLHPSLPFLIPHQAIHDVEVGGFVVPKDAQILCNVWAIGRDPKVWSDPETFMPERFLGVEIDYRGQNFELIPFGGGRRMCPGLNIAHRMLHLMLSSFIHKFDWKLEGNMRVEDLDMSEKFGIACPRNVSLMLVPTKL